MIAAALQRLREWGVVSVTVASAPEAVGFYEALGFALEMAGTSPPGGSVRLVVSLG